MLLFLALAGLASATNPEGQAYLDENAQADGVIVLPSGLQYKVLQSGPADGARPASKGDSCTCHYTGKLIDGTIFFNLLGGLALPLVLSSCLRPHSTDAYKLV